MSDPLRAEPLILPDEPKEGARQADVLLVEGLDRYFSGRYEDAIHIWTRVLFLDRSHARARAYIDRARSALSERQRQSDEMLQTTQNLLDRGETDAARDLLSQAAASAGDEAQVAALRLKLERAERISSGSSHGLAIRPAPDALPGWTWPSPEAEKGRRTTLAIIGVALTVALALALSWEWGGAARPSQALAAPAAPARMEVLTSSEVALVRARTLYGRGRLAEALQALDRVDDWSPIRADADALRVEIQRLLLASGGERHGR